VASRARATLPRARHRSGDRAGRSSRTPFDDQAADLLAEFAPPVVSFHFGLPPTLLLARVKAWGAKILCSATTVAEARWLELRGADAIIAQGLEAGGHRGSFLSDDLTLQAGTFALLPQIVSAVSVPVIAAGGIADASGVAAAIGDGRCWSSSRHDVFALSGGHDACGASRRAQSHAARHTAITNLFTGASGSWHCQSRHAGAGAISPVAPAFPLATAAIAPLRAKAESQGAGDYSPLWCGQNATGCREVPAAQMTRELAALL
jgi:nitronate monooxygenase